jgi:hypothetical protein
MYIAKSSRHKGSSNANHKDHLMIQIRPLFLDVDPVKAAKALDDVTLKNQIVRMTLVLREASLTVEERNIMKSMPAIKWASRHRLSYMWLVNHCLGLLKEFAIRFNQIHEQSHEVHKIFAASTYYAKSLEGQKCGPIEGFPNTIPSRQSACIRRDRYHFLKNYLNSSSPSPWTNTPPPAWLRVVQV